MRVEAEGVRHAYDDEPTLDGLSFSLPAGRIGCLLGPSGCGKTTALRCIAGFEEIHAGAIHLNGHLLSRPGFTLPAEERRMGMVFQDFALFPHLTAVDNVAFGLRHLDRRRRRTRALDHLKLVGLEDLAGRYPHELSGGQQQRVALARALAPQPRVVLLDEPLASLDADMREHLGRELRAILKRQGATAVMVTHDQMEAFAVADEVGVMREGRIEQWDEPYNLYHRPATRFVANFVGQGVTIPGVLNEDGSVETEVGVLEGILTNPVPPGDVHVLLRPDDVGHDRASELTAVVERKAFRGAQTQYTLALPTGTRLMSQVNSHHNHEIGERVGVRLKARHIVAFPR